MYVSVRTQEGVSFIKSMTEEEIYTKSFNSESTFVYKKRNLIFDGGFIKFSGLKLEYLRLNTAQKRYPEFVNYFETKRYGFKDVPIDLMEKYYDDFINIGYIEQHQRPSKTQVYHITEGVLLVEPKDKIYKKIAIGGNIIFEE